MSRHVFVTNHVKICIICKKEYPFYCFNDRGVCSMCEDSVECDSSFQEELRFEQDDFSIYCQNEARDYFACE